MESSLKNSRLSKSVQYRATEDYSRSTVRVNNQVILEASQLIEGSRYMEALEMLNKLKESCDPRKDSVYYQELCFHIALLYSRIGNYEQAISLLKTLPSSPFLSCRVSTLLIVICLKTSEYHNIESLLNSFLSHYKSLPQKLRIQTARQFCIKLIGLETLKDCSLANHTEPTNPDEFLIVGIYKMLAGEYKQAKYYFMKGLQIWREAKNQSESLVYLELIGEMNKRIGKDNQKYEKEIDKLQKRLGLKEQDLKNYLERIALIRNIMDTFQKQQSTEDKVESMHRQLPIQATKVAIYQRVYKNVKNIRQDIVKCKLQLERLPKKQQQTLGRQLKSRITYLDHSRIQLQRFMKDLELPSNQDTVYLLTKYKYAAEAYEQMARNTNSFMKKISRWLLRLGLNALIRMTEFGSD